MNKLRRVIEAGRRVARRFSQPPHSAPAGRWPARNAQEAASHCLGLIQEGALKKALSRVRHAQESWPGTAQLIQIELQCLIGLRQVEPAEIALRNLGKIETNTEVLADFSRRVALLQITRAYENGNFQNSRSHLEKARQRWPDADEFLRPEIRLLVLMGDDAAAVEKIAIFRGKDLQPEKRTDALIHDAMRKRQALLADGGHAEQAVNEWFEQVARYPGTPRSPNQFVDNCLAAQQAGAKRGALARLNSLSQSAHAGKIPQTAQALEQVLAQLHPHDWLPRYLRLFPRVIAPEQTDVAIRSLGHALQQLEPQAAERFFATNRAELASLITSYSRGPVTLTDPDMALDLAEMCFAVLGPDSFTYSLRAKIHFQRENFEESYADISAALALDPHAFDVLEVEFTLLGQAGRHEDVSRRLAELEKSGDFTPVKLARLAGKGQMTHTARKIFQAAISAAPKDRALVSAYLKFCYHSGYWGHCIAAFEADPSLRPGHPVIATELDQLVAQAGQSGAAISADPEAFQANTVAYRLAADQPVSLSAPANITHPAAAPGKRVAVVIDSLGPGGAERQCSVLLRSLARDPEGYGISQLQLFCTNLTQSAKSSFLLEDVRAAGIEPVEYFSHARSLPAEPPALAHMLPRARAQVMVQLRAALHEFQPDVVHGILNEAILNAGMAAIHLGNTRFVGRWGSLPPSYDRQLSQRADDNNIYMQNAYRELLARHPNAAFYSNATQATRAYEEWLEQPSGTFGTIYNGIEADRFHVDPQARADIRRELGIDADAVVIGTAFRFTEEKRPFTWLDVAQQTAAQSGAKLAFIMLGNGPLLLPAQRYAAERGIENVHFVGRQSDIGRWWSAIDIGLMTSSVEGISNTVIEAQLLGRPVAGFDVGGMGEAIDSPHTGQLFPDGDVAAMVGYLAALSEDPQRLGTLSKAASQFARERFSAEMLARNTAALY
ncbi:MAG: glycosyltransferase [Sulfitobacter sp.]